MCSPGAGRTALVVDIRTRRHDYAQVMVTERFEVW